MEPKFYEEIYNMDYWFFKSVGERLQSLSEAKLTVDKKFLAEVRQASKDCNKLIELYDQDFVNNLPKMEELSNKVFDFLKANIFRLWI